MQETISVTPGTPFATVQTILFLRGVHDAIIDAFAFAYLSEPDEALLQAITLAAASDTLIKIVNRNPDLPID